MEAFLANLKIVLPIIGLDLLKPRPQVDNSFSVQPAEETAPQSIVFEIRHKTGVKASAVEVDDEFVVLKGSEARKDTQNSGRGYQGLKQELIAQGVLAATPDSTNFVFTRDYGFSSPSAAAAVVLDRNANGRIEWKTVNGNWTYHQWQDRRPEGLSSGLVAER